MATDLDPTQPLSARREGPLGTGGLVIVATYNEADNIGPLLEAIHEHLPGADVLVIDDGSPDGTGTLVDQRIAELATADPENLSSRTDADSAARSTSGRRGWLSVLHRPGKLGLGTAAVAGFQAALDGGYDVAITLDADFSHPPERLPALWDAVQRADVAIGSRYTPGGSVVGWPLRRRIASALINRFARLMFRLPISDVSGAFRAYRTAILADIRPNQLTSRGYSYLEEILLHLRRHGATFAEVPIRFVDRERGQSKITIQEAVTAVATIVRLSLSRSRGN